MFFLFLSTFFLLHSDCVKLRDCLCIIEREKNEKERLCERLPGIFCAGSGKCIVFDFDAGNLYIKLSSSK